MPQRHGSEKLSEHEFFRLLFCICFYCSLATRIFSHCLIFIHRSNEIYFIENCDMPIRSWKKRKMKVWTENEQNLNTNGKRRNIDCQHWSRKQIVNADYRGKGNKSLRAWLHQIVGREPSRTWDKGSHAKLNVHDPSTEETRTKKFFPEKKKL